MLLVLIIVVGTSIWVYFDAKSLGFKRTGKGGLTDMGPGSWLAGSLLLWIVIFPIYLVARSRFKKDKVSTVQAASEQSGNAGLVKCAKCGLGQKPDAKFCTGCGAEMPKGQFCTNCGTANKPDAKFCKNCGKAVV